MDTRIEGIPQPCLCGKGRAGGDARRRRGRASFPGMGGAARVAGMLLLPAVLAAPAHAQSPFDGTWQTVITCTGARDGAASYTRRFQSAVTGGVLHGQVGVQDQPGFLAIDGPIGGDGQALFTGRGMTGDPTYVVGRLNPGTPYSFHLQARFTATSGTGRRVEVRPCEASFSRQ